MRVRRLGDASARPFPVPTGSSPALGVVPRQLGGAIADALNEHLLPEGYFAEEHAQIGASGRNRRRRPLTIRDRPHPAAGPITTLPARVWTPPAAAMVIPAAFPDALRSWSSRAKGGADSLRPSSWSAPPTRIATPTARRLRSSVPAISVRESA